MSLFLPMFLPRDPPAPARGDVPPPSGWLVTENVTDTVEEHGVPLIRTAALRVGRDRAVGQGETLMFLSGHRVWLFSDLESARIWLTLPSRATPSAKSGLATGLGIDHAGSTALAGWSPPAEDDDVPNGFLLKAEQTSQGIQIRISTPVGNSPPAATAGLAELLPRGAVLSFVAPNVPAGPVWGFRSLGLLAQADGLPPLWLWQAAEGATFGWYPARGARDRDDWVSVLPWSSAVDKAWRAHDLPVPTSTLASVGPISFVRLGGFLFLGTRKDLIGWPTKPQAAQPAAPALTAAAAGTELARLLEHRAMGPGVGRETAEELKVAASIASLIASIETRGSITNGTLDSGTKIRPSVAASHVGSSVDELLRSRQLKNSLHLPRPLDTKATEQGITLTFKGASAESMRRAFPDSDRLTLAQVSPGVFSAKIAPRPRHLTPAPLSARERDLYLTPDGTPPPGAIKTTATDIVGKATSAWDRMRAVVDWVSRGMKYELTPRQLDDVTLLETRRGDCTEYAQLTIALLRALGIPARMRSGLAGEGSLLVAHAWVEFHDGTAWHEIDPTAGRTSVDASYIDASVMDLLPLLSDGGVRVVSVE
jgi:hypothetical protein